MIGTTFNKLKLITYHDSFAHQFFLRKIAFILIITSALRLVSNSIVDVSFLTPEESFSMLAVLDDNFVLMPVFFHITCLLTVVFVF